MKKSNLFIGLFLLSIVFVYGCTGGNTHNIQGQAVAQGNANVGNNNGNLAPDFTVKTIDGQTLSLSQLSSDKPTVLYFFATWCPHCANDLSAVSRAYPEFSDKVNFLAIDMDTRESERTIANFKQRMNLNNVQFAPGSGGILGDYGVSYTTTKYFIGKNGIILNKGVGEVGEGTWRQIFQSLSQ